VITNTLQQVVWRYESDDPFGNNAPNENPSGLGNFTCNLRMPGQYYDKETNLQYNDFRDYEPAIGRYVQSDPIGLQGGINTYAYVGSNPLSYVDPDGLDPSKIPPNQFGSSAFVRDPGQVPELL
jgi:RHS repeat-associated protein